MWNRPERSDLLYLFHFIDFFHISQLVHRHHLRKFQRLQSYGSFESFFSLSALEDFGRLWVKFDPTGTGYMPIECLPELIVLIIEREIGLYDQAKKEFRNLKRGDSRSKIQQDDF